MNANYQISSPAEQNLFGQLQLKSPEAVDYNWEIAGIGARSHAFVIDWHIRVLLALAWLLMVGYSIFSWADIKQFLWENASTTALYIWLVPALAIYFLYHPLLEIAMAGRTPGKRMAGVRLVTLKGLTPGAGALLLRNVFRLLDCLPAFYVLGLAVVALTRNSVRIGDLAAGLVLVYDSGVNRKALQSVTGLVMNSRFSSDNLALLLDLLKRWGDLQINARIRLAEQFLTKIGIPVPHPVNEKQTHRSKVLKQQLEQLLNGDKELRK